MAHPNRPGYLLMRFAECQHAPTATGRRQWYTAYWSNLIW